MSYGSACEVYGSAGFKKPYVKFPFHCPNTHDQSAVIGAADASLKCIHRRRVPGTIANMTWQLLVLLSSLSIAPTFAQQRRYMPPPAVECDRNELTSHTGEVTRYTREADKISLTLKTDDETVESVSLHRGDKILLNARQMSKDDWKLVEEKQGKLRQRMRATVWICRGGRPVLDWQPPKQ